MGAQPGEARPVASCDNHGRGLYERLERVYFYSVAAYYKSNPSASGYDANGNIIAFNDSVMGSWSYQYDSLNRVVGGKELSGGPTPGWSDCFAYDAWGNRTGEAYSGTDCGSSPTPTSWADYDTGNHISSTGLMPGGEHLRRGRPTSK